MKIRLAPFLLTLLVVLSLPGLADPAPPPGRLSGPLIDGRPFSLEAERGKVVLVQFWAMDSLASRKSMPELQRFYAGYQGRGVEVLAVSIDDSVAEVRDFVRERGFTMPVMGRRQAVEDDFPAAVRAPVLYVVGPDGRVAGRHAGLYRYRTLEELVKPLLVAP